jgi:hypothetical protein
MINVTQASHTSISFLLISSRVKYIQM